MGKNENAIQADLIDELEKRYEGCVVLKNDASYKQGIPDLSVFYKNRYAILETKKNEKARFRPNQEMYLDLFNEWSFARRIEPSNKEEVLHELDEFFGI